MTYRATRQDDGTLVVHDVPIFVECERGDLKFDAKWIGQAVSAAMAAEREGYLPPLHLRHHDKKGEDKDVRAAGFFRITRSAPIKFKGATRIAVFADLHLTDPSAAEMVLAKRLPYRSVEIFNVDKPMLDGLALLDHEAPFLQLPMLMVSRVDEMAGAGVGVSGDTFAARWSCEGPSTRDSVACLYRSGRKAMMLFQADDQEMMMADEPKKDDEKPKDEKMAEGSAVDVSAVCKAIASGEITVAGMDEIMAAIAAYQSKAQPKADGEAEAPAPGNAAMSAAASSAADQRTSGSGNPMKDDNTNAVQFAQMRAEIDGLNAKLKAQEAKATQAAMVQGALKRLAGRPLGSDIEAKLAQFAAFGVDQFNAYVETLEKVVGPMPDNGAHMAAIVDSPAVVAYQAKGPAEVEKAIKFSNQWRDANAIGATSLTESSFIEAAFARERLMARSN